MKVYLDNAATTELTESMKQYLISLLDQWGNPSSLYTAGESTRQIILGARQSVAAFLNASPKDIYFTPSGSAANTLAIRGYCSRHKCRVLYSPIAHTSVLKCVESCRDSHPLKVDKHGFIDFEDLKRRLDDGGPEPFVVIDYANSEIGSVQDVEKLIELTHFYNGVVYLDCTGSIPSIAVDAGKLDADMLGFSAHKLGGLKGCGALYKKSSASLEPLIYGSQEGSLAAGTENILGIASLGKAVMDHDYSSVSPAGRDYVYKYIVRNIPDHYLVGAPIESGNRLPHNLYICFRGVEGESLMFLLDMYGIQVSTGSACNSKNISASPALSAIGMAPADIHSCIRLTFSGRETKKQLDYVCDVLNRCVAGLRDLPPAFI